MSFRARILIVDDEPDILENCKLILERRGYEVLTLPESTKLDVAVREFDPDMILTDLMIPGLDGMGVLRRVNEEYTGLPVVMMTAYATVETAVEAMKRGAEDYIVKPFTKDHLEMVVNRVIGNLELRRENVRLKGELQKQELRHALIAQSPSMQDVISVISRVADSRTSVMVLGESGTGKEVVARAIHREAFDSGAPFVAVNCSALPSNLIESELFGYEKGAFTGATSTRKGLLEEASGGTFFLDEITEMDSAMQSKLLRVIQERQVRRVGGNREIDIDVRFISASNQDIQEAIASGQLREDLYFRLAVVSLKLPPLRERRKDIAALAEHFLQEFTAESKRKIGGFAPRVLELLEQYPWPGNVRELRNVVERAAALTTRAVLREEDLPEEIRSRSARREIKIDYTEPYAEAKARAMDSLQREYFSALLEEENHNISRVAERARVDRKTIYRIMKTYDLGKDDGDSEP